MAEYITIKRRVSLDAPISPESLPGFTYMTEHQAHEFIISVRKNGEKETITGSVSANVIRPNGTTIFLQGSISDGDAVVRLHRDCYNIPGRLKISIFNTSGGVTTCIYSATYTNDRSTTDNVIDAGDVVPDISDVVAKQEEMTQVIADARTATSAANTAAQNVGSIVARPYSSSSTYTAGDYCTNNGNLYKANQDISTAEEWTASHWTQIVMGDDVTSLKSAIDETIENIAPINWYNPNGTGYYNLSGNFNEASYFHWQDIPAVEGDVYRFYNWDGSQYISVNARYIVNYKNNAVASGSKENVATYTVPSGIDFIRVSINTASNSKPCITKNTEDIPTSEETYYPPATVVITDKTLSDTNLPANAKAVGDRLSDLHNELLGVELDLSTIAEESVSINKYNPDGVGYYNLAGTYQDSASHHWQDVVANEGNIWRIYNWDGNAYVPARFNFVVPYKNGVAQSGGVSNVASFTVPSGRDTVRFSINTAIYTKPLMTLNTDTVPTVETEYYEDTYAVKTDKTLTSQTLPANSRYVGIAIRDSFLYPVDAVKADMSMFSNFAACGDSFTIGSIFNSSGVLQGDFRESSWASVLGRMIGAESYIFASGGSNTKLYQTRTTDLPALLADTPKQLYLLCLGINDATAITKGTVADLNDDYTLNPDTYYGNYGRIISQIKAHAPDAKIIMSKVFIPTYYNSEFYNYSSQAVEEIANYYGIPFIDPIDIPYMCTDEYNAMIRSHGSHPTAPLYSAIAKAVKTMVDNCINNNKNYFNDFHISES